MQRAYARLHQHDVRAKQTKVCDAERTGFPTPAYTSNYLQTDRRANKFDRVFPSVDDSEHYFNCGAAATSIVMTAQKENSNEDERAESAVKALVLFKLQIGM